LPPAREAETQPYLSHFQQLTNGLVVAISLPPQRLLGGHFTVEGAADNHEAAVFSSAFDLLAVALMVKFSFRRGYQRRKAEKHHPSADGSALLAE
jgi:hypothetical protein